MTTRRRSAIILVGICLLMISCTSDVLLKRESTVGLNGSFEITDSGYPVNWEFFPNPETNSALQVIVDTTYAVEGNQSIKLVAREIDDVVGIQSQQVQVQSGKTYRISLSVKLSGCSVWVRRATWDADSVPVNSRLAKVADDLRSPGEWQHFEDILTIPERETSIYVGLSVIGSGTVWCDDVRIEEVAE
jgi:hypothetical protein